MARNILVTGGGGFIGSHLVERLEADRVDVIDSLSRGNRDWLPPEALLHAIDIRSPADVQRAVGQALPNVVVHLAALHFLPEVDGAPQLAWEVNVEGTRNLLEALVDKPPDLFLFGSTAAVSRPAGSHARVVSGQPGRRLREDQGRGRAPTLKVP